MNEGSRPNIPRLRIDWDAVKRRLDADTRRIETALQPTATHIAAIHRKRAETMARRTSELDSAEDQIAMMLLRMRGERYLLPALEVTEVTSFHHCTPVPTARHELLGVMSVRGEIRSIVDLAEVLSLPPLPAAQSAAQGDHVLFLRQTPLLGIRVDRCEQVVSLNASDVACDETAGSSELSGRYVRGVVQDRLLMLDLDALYSHPAISGAVVT